MLITVAIPCYKSGRTLGEVVKEIKYEFSLRPEYDYQIILVNDGSPDNTFEVIYDLCKNDPKIIGVNLAKNFGQAAAKAAVFNYVDGEVLVSMDDDGQHPPAGIFELVDAINNGDDLVYAHFESKQHSGIRVVSSRLHNWIMYLTGTKSREIKSSSFYALSAFAIKTIRKNPLAWNTGPRFLRLVSNRVSNVAMEHRDRKYGTSNYTFKMLFSKWFDTLTLYNVFLIRLIFRSGLLFSIGGLIGAVIMVVLRILRPGMPVGFASLMVVLLTVSGIMMLLMGIVGEYVGKLYLMVGGFPMYAVRETLNAKEVS